MKIDNWFTGIVEDYDPYHSRARVRMFGLHSFNASDISTTDLPWATLLIPTTTPSAQAHNNKELLGRCVFGFFRDGDDMQDAIVIGVYEGKWNQNNNGGYNPEFNSPGYYNSMPPANSLFGTISVGANTIGSISSGGYIPLTSAHGSGLLQEFDQTLAGSGYNSSIANRIIQPALSQLGRNISYATNTGSIAEYFSATNYKNGASARAPWCAAFVCWAIKQSGLFDEDTRPKSAIAYDFDDWAKTVKNRVALRYSPTDVQPGDIVAYSWSHVGIVTQSNAGQNTFKTIEGNTGSPGRVAERTQNLLGRVKYSVRIVS